MEAKARKRFYHFTFDKFLQWIDDTKGNKKTPKTNMIQVIQ